MTDSLTETRRRLARFERQRSDGTRTRDPQLGRLTIYKDKAGHRRPIVAIYKVTPAQTGPERPRIAILVPDIPHDTIAALSLSPSRIYQ